MTTIDNVLFGLNTFGDIATDNDGNRLSDAESTRLVVKEAVLADKLGIDVIGVGEHHREEYAISSPETVLAGIATLTENITLATAVTVLSSDDPVRVYQRFATVDALSNGRAQVMLGRGSFTESFPLFGYDLKNYNELFEEKLAMFAQILEEKPLDWQGEFTQTLEQAEILPKTDSGKLDTWIGVGGSPESIIRTARYGFPLMLAIIGGDPIRFKAYIDLYKRAAQQLSTPIHPVGMHSHGLIADTDEEARELAWNHIKKSFDKIGSSRGWTPMTRGQFEQEIEHGSYYVGSPETVAKKIASAIQRLGVGRFDLVYGAGLQSDEVRKKTIELYGKEVIPQVKAILSKGE